MEKHLTLWGVMSIDNGRLIPQDLGDDGWTPPFLLRWKREVLPLVYPDAEGGEKPVRVTLTWDDGR